MAPPTASEQLIRDYLNRLSVAARDLAPDDRRALLERTRSLIDQKADLARRPSTMDVARVLSRLGDPARLVEQERRRLAAQGGSARSATSATAAVPARQRFLARALGREHGRLRGLSFGWPAQPDSPSGPPVAASNGAANGIQPREAPTRRDSGDEAAADVGPAAEPESHAELSPSARAAAAPASSATASPDRPSDGYGPVGAEGPQSASPPPDASAPAHVTLAPAAELPRREQSAVGPPGSPDSGAGTQPPGASGTQRSGRRTVPPIAASAIDRIGPSGDSAAATDAMAAGPGPEAAEAGPAGRRWRRPRASMLRGPAGRRVGSLLAWARKRPLEAAAIVLMGIGGPIFPPVFLIGATLALASELWDGRDKWVGLALPIVLTVIGLAVGVAAGGRAHWMHESWVYLDVVSRVAPALGAGYLAWRCQSPRRPSSLPPFSRPYRAS